MRELPSKLRREFKNSQNCGQKMELKLKLFWPIRKLRRSTMSNAGWFLTLKTDLEASNLTPEFKKIIIKNLGAIVKSP